MERSEMSNVNFGHSQDKVRSEQPHDVQSFGRVAVKRIFEGQ